MAGKANQKIHGLNDQVVKEEVSINGLLQSLNDGQPEELKQSTRTSPMAKAGRTRTSYSHQRKVIFDECDEIENPIQHLKQLKQTRGQRVLHDSNKQGGVYKHLTASPIPPHSICRHWDR